MIDWRLGDLLQSHGITSSTAFCRSLEEKTGIRLSRQALGRLKNENPRELRLETVQAICNLLGCSLSDFLEVRPDPNFQKPVEIVRPYQRKSKVAGSIFSDPGELM